MANTATMTLMPLDFAGVDRLTLYDQNPAGLPAPPNRVFPVAGHRMPHGLITTFFAIRRIPEEMLLTTGLTFTPVFAMPPNVNNADRNGTKAAFDVTVAPLVSGTSTPDNGSLGGATPVQIQTAALPTATNIILFQDIAVPIASMASLAVGNIALIRFRRLGNVATDTHLGDLVLLDLAARGT